MRDNQHNIKTWLDELGNLRNNDSASRLPDTNCNSITVERPTARLGTVSKGYWKNKKSKNEVII